MGLGRLGRGEDTDGVTGDSVEIPRSEGGACRQLKGRGMIANMSKVRRDGRARWEVKRVNRGGGDQGATSGSTEERQ